MWNLIESVPDHCLSFYFELSISVDATFYGVTIGMDQTTQA